jgi:type I restriction enzyme S subunit
MGALMISDGYRVRNDELGPSGIPFVRGGDIGDGWINTNTEDHIKPELAYRVTAKVTKPGDVAFITKGTVGRAGYLRAGQEPVVFAPQVAYWRVLDETMLDPRFIYYFIRSRAFQSALDGVKTHGAMVADYVSISQQHDFTIALPAVRSQRAISRTLGALDDKIEVNRKMSAALEAIARALFTSWFVDFEPVYAKMEGCETGLAPEIAAVFPDSFFPSKHGDIPRGWSFGSIVDTANLNPEAWSKATRPDVVRYIDLSGVKWGKIEAPTIYERDQAPSRAQRILRRGDTLVGTVRPANGSYALVDEDGLTGSTGFAVLRPRDSKAFTYLAATSRRNIERLGHLADGGAYPAVRPEVVGETPVALPPAAVLRAFETMVSPLLDRCAQAGRESSTVAAIRDALLPKLLSGELCVANVEKVLEKSA